MLVTGDRTCCRAWITLTLKASTAFRPMSSLQQKVMLNISDKSKSLVFVPVDTGDENLALVVVDEEAPDHRELVKGFTVFKVGLSSNQVLALARTSQSTAFLCTRIDPTGSFRLWETPTKARPSVAKSNWNFNSQPLELMTLERNNFVTTWSQAFKRYFLNYLELSKQ